MCIDDSCYCVCILYSIFRFSSFGIPFHFIISAFSKSWKFRKSRGFLRMYRFNWTHICSIALRSCDRLGQSLAIQVCLFMCLQLLAYAHSIESWHRQHSFPASQLLPGGHFREGWSTFYAFFLNVYAFSYQSKRQCEKKNFI